MMRFILDCLRPARARAAAAAREPVEVLEKGTADDNEIKELKDELNMEEENLQKVKVLCCETRETMENLEEKKTQLRDQLKIIHDLHKQEKYMLQSLLGEQREVQQTLEQYKMELRAASDDLLQLQVEVTCAKARAEKMHEYIAPLQESFKEIEQVKQKLDELIAGLMTDNIIEMTEEAAGEVLEQESIGNTDVEIITSNQKSEEVKHVERESTAEKLDKMQCSAENLKSSGSSSFTEITLTEVKEEDVMLRSNTPQLDSSDMEEEDFEIVQASLATQRKFNFFHPNPFIDGDVFGDDHFPKVDVTGLPRDPFKGTDPFASDTAFVDISEEKHCQDGFITAENSLQEAIHCPLHSVGKDKDYGTFNAPFNMPFGADFKQPTGKIDRCVSMPTESSSLKSFRDVCPKVGTNPTQGQNLDSLQPDVTKEGVSSQLDKDCVHESSSSHSSTSFNSFDVDCNTFAGVEDEEDRVRVQAGFNFIGRDVSLCGLQSIIAGSYTGFPLSPCDPKPFPGISGTEKAFEDKFSSISSEQNDVNDKDCYQSELGNAKSCSLDLGFNSPDSQYEELHDVNGDACNLTSICETQPSALDAYDYKYGDMFFFTVRLDPGSPEILNPSPVCSEPNDLKKCQSLSQLPWKENPLSLEFNDTDELKCCAPKPEDIKQLITDDQKSFDKIEFINKETNSPPSKQNEKLRSNSETGNLHACQNMLSSENDDEWKANLGVVEHDPFSPLAAGSAECVSEFEDMYTVYSFSYDAPRLDSGYHEAGTPIPFSSEPIDPSKCCIDLKGPCLETIKQSNSKIQVPDPFSLESVDTGIFGSETENCESGYMIAKCQPFISQMAYTYLSNPDERQMSFINTESCDVLSDHFNGSELDCDSFSYFPDNIESHDIYSSEENVIAGSIQNGSATNGDTKPSSMVSNPNSSSPVIQCGSVKRNSEMSHSYPEVIDSDKLSKNSMIHVVFESEFEHFVPNISKQAEEAKNLKVNITKKADLAEIDSFCSELSKMVSSHSSDSVQLSVAEMLFGSDPNTSRFYPWDFEKQQHSC